MRPNKFYPYNDSWTSSKRISKVIEIATLPRCRRPNLITAYLSILDELGHQQGPFSQAFNEELVKVDQLIGELKRVVVDELAGNLVIVSDHGMVDLPTNQHLLLSDWLPNYKDRVLFADFGPVCSIIPKPGHTQGILEDLKFGEKSGAPFRVYTSKTLPKEWNYFDNDRIAPILIQCDKVHRLRK
jgi:predicted AlkP superfamily pyrophosphatase or phosphodiesterase